MFNLDTLKAFDPSRFDPTKIDLTKLDLPRIELKRLDLRNIDVPTLRLPKVDVPFELPKMDLSKVDLPFDRVVGLARDAAYVGIGAIVVATQSADERRRSVADQVTTRMRKVIDTIA